VSFIVCVDDRPRPIPQDGGGQKEKAMHQVFDNQSRLANLGIDEELVLGANNFTFLK
jgi:hypothetical protein